MPRILALRIDNAPEASREMMSALRKKVGKVPNVLASMAHSPAALKVYVAANAALAEAKLSARLQECIALAVGQRNDCAYCVAAHTAKGKMVGLTADDTVLCRQGDGPDERSRAVVRFSLRVLETNGFVSDEDMDAVRAAGFGDAEIAEIMATISVNIYTNLMNHVADTKVDFPAAPPM